MVSIISWDEFAGLASAPVTRTLQGRVVSADEPAERVAFSPPDLWRVEDDHGRLRYLANETGHYHTLAYQSPDGLLLVGFTSLVTGIRLPPETFASPSNAPDS